MARWTDLTVVFWRLFAEHGLLVAFLLLFIEESGIGPLVHGDALMLLTGMRAAEGKLALIAAIGVLEPATVLGGGVPHWVWA